MSAERPTNEDHLKQDLERLKDPARYKEASLEIGSLQQAIDLLARLNRFVLVDQGSGVAWDKLYHATEHLRKDLEAKLSEGKTEETR